MGRPTAVLWIYQQVKTQKGHHLESGQKPSLCFKGRDWMLCVGAGYPVRVLKRPASDFNKMRRATFNGTEYPADRAAAHLTKLGKVNGITLGAQRLLALVSAPEIELKEDEYNDEEDQIVKNETNPAEVASATEEGETPNNVTEEKTVTAKKKAPKKAAAKAAKAKAPKSVKTKAPKSVKTKAPKTPKTPKGPSRIASAVEFMKEEVKKAGGQGKLEHGFRKELFERTAKKFDLEVSTCGAQYSRKVLK
jgi:hypothetical protein